MKAELMEHYRSISGSSESINFKRLLIALGKVMKTASEAEPVSMDYNLLLARCNIFEALLIKHFRSAEDFEKIMMR
jgi:hypothetical protein